MDLQNFQPKGNYALKTDLQNFQTKGNYQETGNYAIKDDLNKYLLSSKYNTDYIPISDFVNKLKANSAFTKLYRI